MKYPGPVAGQDSSRNNFIILPGPGNGRCTLGATRSSTGGFSVG
ncbi:hypothetical protein [Endozoicomonas sp. ONNA2]|nr:hypothetical protein [Endozoicomonas sp. ONNA2]